MPRLAPIDLLPALVLGPASSLLACHVAPPRVEPLAPRLAPAAAEAAAAPGPAADPTSAVPVPATVTGQAMGGMLRIVVRCPTADQHAACLAAGLVARREIERIEALATDWRPEGEIARLNAHAGQGPQPVSPEVHDLLAASIALAAATRGAFDPTIGALWGLWDFDAGVVPADADIDARKALVDWTGLTLGEGEAALARPGMAVTLGGIAQGYAAARALRQIPAQWDAMVDVSGDIAVRGRWEIGIQDPSGARGESLGTVVLQDATLVTSGDYEKGFLRDGTWYHHVLDPRTGRPAHGAHQATVVHRDGATADGLATALLVLGRDEAVVRALSAWALVVDDHGPSAIGSGIDWRPAPAPPADDAPTP